MATVEEQAKVLNQEPIRWQFLDIIRVRGDLKDPLEMVPLPYTFPTFSKNLVPEVVNFVVVPKVQKSPRVQKRSRKSASLKVKGRRAVRSKRYGMVTKFAKAILDIEMIQLRAELAMERKKIQTYERVMLAAWSKYVCVD